MDSFIGEERITTRDTSEYLVVHILQSTTGVLDEYVIQSITIRYPIPITDGDGNELYKVKWTPGKVGEDGRWMRVNLTSTRYYIPINIHTKMKLMKLAIVMKL